MEGPSQQVEPSKRQSPPLSRIGLNSHKAGMEGLDKDKINKVIIEASRGSKYYQNELRKDQDINKKVNHMLATLKKVTPARRVAAAKAVDKKVQEMEMSRDLSRTIVHVDMDAFYAAVEMRDNPSLKDCPMAVGSNSMLSTSNYAARRYGVRAAMPGFIARKLCPNLVIVNPNFDKYHKANEEVQKVLSEYDPNFCSVGLDESYLDITNYVQRKVDFKRVSTETGCSDCSDDGSSLSAELVVQDIRESIHRATSLTASAGIAPNKMLAKIASDMNKPNGQFMVRATREKVLEFLEELPIRKISGIGRVTEKMLNALDITLCCHLYEKREILHLLFSQASSDFFLASCLGLGSIEVQRFGDRKSMSIERSFSPTSDQVEQMARCKEICQTLAGDMQKENIKGRTVTLKMKTADFEVKSRGLTLPRSISKSGEILRVASDLLRQEIEVFGQIPLKLRLLGVRMSSLLSSECADDSQETLKAFLSSTEGIEQASSTDILQARSPLSVCPICGVKMSTNNNPILNQHIDECLNRSTIESVIEESLPITKSRKSYKRSQRSLTTYLVAEDRSIKKQKYEQNAPLM